MTGRTRIITAAFVILAASIVDLRSSGAVAVAGGHMTRMLPERKASPTRRRAAARPKSTQAPAATGASTTAAAGGTPPQTRTCSAPVRVMPLGDSLTGFPESYRGPLFRTLTAKGFRVDFVGSISSPPAGGGDPDSNGWGGYRIGPDTIKDFGGNPADLFDNADKWFRENRPDVVLLVIGTNDLAAGGDVWKAAPAKYDALIQKIAALAPDAELLVGDMPPIASHFDGLPEQLAFNKVGADAAAASATDRIIHVPIFDRLHDTLDPATDYADGIHFRVSGGVKFANAWLPELTTVLSARGCK